MRKRKQKLTTKVIPKTSRQQPEDEGYSDEITRHIFWTTLVTGRTFFYIYRTINRAHFRYQYSNSFSQQ